MRRMQRSVLALALLAGAALSGGPASAMPTYDGFGDYTTGATLPSQPGGGYGWNGAWGGGGLPVTVAAPGLAFPGLDTSPGAATSSAPVVNTVAWYWRDVQPGIGDGTTFYLSFLLRPEIAISDYGGLSIWGSAGSIFIGESGAAAGGSHAYGLEANVTSAIIASSSVMASPGETALLVLKATLGVGPDLFELFVNPLPGTSEADNLVAASFDTAMGVDLGNLTFIAINNEGNWTTDEIRIGASFASVTPMTVPTPAPAALLLLGQILLLARGRQAR
jgi:hypothetical protein